MSAKVKVVAHFNFGKNGNITNAAAPVTVYSADSKEKLQAAGNPVFNAEAPAEKGLTGDGCILFSGQGDGYIGNKAFGSNGDNMVLEVWVKARTLDHGDGHQNVSRPVVSNGGLGSGYSIAQRGKQWVLVNGKSRFVIEI